MLKDSLYNIVIKTILAMFVFEKNGFFLSNYQFPKFERKSIDINPLILNMREIIENNLSNNRAKHVQSG